MLPSSSLRSASRWPPVCFSAWRPPGTPHARISIPFSSRAGRSSIGGQHLIVRHGLVAGELALATILLVGAGLLLQSLERLQQVRVGFRPEGVLTFQLALPAARYSGPGETLVALSTGAGVARRHSRRQRRGHVERHSDGSGQLQPVAVHADWRFHPAGGSVAPDRLANRQPRLLPPDGHPAALRTRLHRSGWARSNRRDRGQPRHRAEVLGQRRTRSARCSTAPRSPVPLP